METKERTDNALRAAFDYLRRSRKTVLQTIADSVNCSRRHLQAALSPTENKSMSGELAHKIAEFYGLDYGQFLELGGRILNGDNPDQFYLDILREKAIDEYVEHTRILAGLQKAPSPPGPRQELHLQYRGNAPAPSFNTAPAPMPQAHRIPLLGRVPAGDPRQITDADILGWESVGPEIPGNAYALKVSGNSMRRPDDNNSISDGDTVIFVEKSNPAHNDMVVVCDEFGDVMLKRLKIKPDGEYVLASDNPAYEPIRPNGAYRIIGVVIDAHRKLSVR